MLKLKEQLLKEKAAAREEKGRLETIKVRPVDLASDHTAFLDQTDHLSSLSSTIPIKRPSFKRRSTKLRRSEPSKRPF